MRPKLLSLIPEFELIKDSGLRKKTVLVWQEAVKRSDWKMEDLAEMPFTLLIENTPVNLIQHTRAVALCCLKVAEILIKEYEERISINLDYLLSGALLHDVGKLFEYKREGKKFIKSKEGKLMRHPISGASFASQFGLPQEIIHIIAAHSKEGDGSRHTVEAIIVNHADFLNFEALQV